MGELEGRRDRTSDQRPVAGAFGALPGGRGHNRLRPLARGEIGSEPHGVLAATLVGDLQAQCTAGVIVPNLGGIDAMPVRAIAARQEEVDRGGQRSTLSIAARVAKRFAIVAAFGMRPELEPSDDVGRGEFRVHQDLFLRSRSSRKTSIAPAPFRCSFSATDGTSARRNTLAFFSSPSSDGIVGLLSARSFATSAARACNAGLSGSTESANFTLEAVYS